MLKQFQNYIREQKLLTTTDKVLLTVSGGIDSVCMAHLFHQSGYSFAIAHCNFGLRGEESDADQQFVEQLAKTYSCELFIQYFNTSTYSQENGISIQMAARDLRYEWFNQLAREHNFTKIAVAHNLNDSSETLLLNLIRGTGLKGLTGIAPSVNRIIRPLLFAERTAIEKYIVANNLTYREDSSNNETKYYRNLIRKEIIPLMQKINPSLHNTVKQETEIFSASHAIYSKQIEHLRQILCVNNGNTLHIDIKQLKEQHITPPILFDILESYGFSYSDSKDILATLDGEPGKQFYSKNYVLLKDRETLVIEKLNEESNYTEYTIDESRTGIIHPIPLLIDVAKRTPDFQIPTSITHIALDKDKLQFPLTLRRWKEGDFFQPLGMKGKKKLSDFFIDRKVNILEKNKTWLLTSKGEIVWIIGHQIDDRFKITSGTKNVIILEVKN